MNLRQKVLMCIVFLIGMIKLIHPTIISDTLAEGIVSILTGLEILFGGVVPPVIAQMRLKRSLNRLRE